MIYVLLKPCLKNFKHHFTSMWDECNCVVVWAFFGIAFLWDWNENWPFPVLWPLLSFPNLLVYWVVWLLGLGQKWKTWLVFTPLGLLVGYLSSLSMSRVHLGLCESQGDFGGVKDIWLLTALEICDYCFWKNHWHPRKNQKFVFPKLLKRRQRVFLCFCLLFMGFILSFINTFKNSIPGTLSPWDKQVERAVPTLKPTSLGTCPGHLRPVLSTTALSGEGVGGRSLYLYLSFMLKHGSRVPGPESGLPSSHRWRNIWAV